MGSDGMYYLSREDEELMKKKFISILSIALVHKHDSVVFSAFGCGFNKNPPNHIVNILANVVIDFFPTHFDNITFSVLEDENSFLRHNHKGNMEMLRNALLQRKKKNTNCNLM